MASGDKIVNLNLKISATDTASATLKEFAASFKEIATEIKDAIAGSFSNNLSAQATDQMGIIERSFSQVSTSARDMASIIAESSKAAAGSLNDIGLASNQLRQHNLETDLGLQEMGMGMQEFGRTMLDGFKYAVEQAATFDGNMARIFAVTSAGGKDVSAAMDEMKTKALDLGMQTSFSANEVAQGMYTMARQGMSATQIISGGANSAIDIVTKLAMATDSSMTTSATVVTDLMREFGLAGDQLHTTADMISGIMHHSSESMDDVLASMRNVAPIAHFMGISIDDVSASLGIMAQAGITGGAAGTSLKNVLQHLTPTTAAAKKAMGDLGLITKDGTNLFYNANGSLKNYDEIVGILHEHLSGLSAEQQNMYLKTLFGQYGLKGLMSVVNMTKDSYDAFKQSLKDDEIYDIADKKMNSLEGDLKRLTSAQETLAKGFGESLRPVLRTVADAVLGVAVWFNNLDDSWKQLITAGVGIAGTISYIAGTLLIMGTVLKMTNLAAVGFGQVIETMMLPLKTMMSAIFSPMTLALLTLIGVVVLVKKAWDTDWDGIREKTVDTWNIIKSNVSKVVDFLKPYISEFMKNLKSEFIGSGPAAKDFLNKLQLGIFEVIHGLHQFFIAIEPVTKAILNFVAQHPQVAIMIGAFLMFGRPIKTITKLFEIFTIGGGGLFRVFGGIVSGVPGVVGALGKFGGFLSGGLGKTFELLGTSVLKTFHFLGDGIFGSIKKFSKAVGDAGGVSKLFKNHMKAIKESAKGLFKPLTEGFSKFFNFFKTGLIPALKNFPKLLKSVFSLEFLKGILSKGLKLFLDFGKGIFTAIRFMMGPWGILITIVLIAVGLIISHWNQIKTWAQEHFGKTFPQVLHSLSQIFSNVWNAISNAFTVAWEFIKQYGGAALKALWDAISSAITTISKWWSDHWDEIKQVFNFVWKALLAILAPAIAFVSTIIIAALGFIKGSWTNIWHIILDVITIVWEAIKTAIKVAWDVISGIIAVALDILTGHWSKAWDDIKGIFVNLWNDILGFLDGVGPAMLDAGKNLIMMLVNGIKGAIGAVGDAVSSVADKIKSFLGFHSPTKEGPASRGESDMWMPNMMAMLSKGIEENTPMIQKAVAKVAMGVNVGMKQTHTNVSNLIAHSMAPTAPNNAASRGNTQPVININIDGRSKQTDKQIVDEMAKRLKQQMNVVSG